MPFSAGTTSPPVAFDDARAMIGAGVKPLLQRALASKGLHFAPAEIDALFDEYLQLYAAHIADRSRPFPGLDGRARRARGATGCRLAVCTNKLEWLSVRLLDALEPVAALRGDLRAGHFRDAQARPGDAAPDHRACRRRCRPRRHGRRLDDRRGDRAAAGMPVVAVDFGYTETPPAELGADRLISHFDALPTRFANCFRPGCVARVERREPELSRGETAPAFVSLKPGYDICDLRLKRRLTIR